jgi:hypothetical protein
MKIRRTREQAQPDAQLELAETSAFKEPQLCLAARAV